MVLGIELRSSYVLGKCSTAEPHTQPLFLYCIWRQRFTNFPRLVLNSMAQSGLKHMLVLCWLLSAGIASRCHQACVIEAGVIVALFLFDVQCFFFVSGVCRT